MTRVSTGASATCRVADRGPADTSRVIDLSYDTYALLAEPGSGPHRRAVSVVTTTR